MIAKLLNDLVNVEDVLIVDSFSDDETVEICKKFGREVVQNKFINQAIQCNWAIDKFFDSGDWILRLDSDERIDELLLTELEALTARNIPIVGYLHREMYWMGKKLKYSALRKHYIGRFFLKGHAVYEEITEEHLIHTCPSINLKTKFYEQNNKNLIDYFIEKHVQTAKGEVNELFQPDKVNKGSLLAKNTHMKTRWLKISFYNKAPIFSRAICYFIYRYFIKCGFLDGRAGFSFCFFQAFFYRMLIDQMYWEKKYQKDDQFNETV
jgi:glycosyltransferase involved in cell wall biosynthesis